MRMRAGLSSGRRGSNGSKTGMGLEADGQLCPAIA